MATAPTSSKRQPKAPNIAAFLPLLLFAAGAAAPLFGGNCPKFDGDNGWPQFVQNLKSAAFSAEQLEHRTVFTGFFSPGIANFI
jgi:hypothetical protein